MKAPLRSGSPCCGSPVAPLRFIRGDSKHPAFWRVRGSHGWITRREWVSWHLDRQAQGDALGVSARGFQDTQRFGEFEAAMNERIRERRRLSACALSPPHFHLLLHGERVRLVPLFQVPIVCSWSPAAAWCRSVSRERPPVSPNSSRAIASSCSTRGRASSSRPCAA